MIAPKLRLYETEKLTLEQWRRDLNIFFEKSNFSKENDYTKTADSILTVSETGIILCTGTHTQTLPVVSGNRGVTYTFVNLGTGIITIDGNGTETINGALTVQLTQWQKAKTYCTGSEWVII